MSGIQPGMYVGRKSYGCDIVFEVKRIYTDPDGTLVALVGALAARLLAHAPLSDLEVLAETRIAEAVKHSMEAARSHLLRSMQRRAMMQEARRSHKQGAEGDGAAPEAYMDIPGSVLHLDGDENYLKQCLKHYHELGVPVTGIHVPEEDQPRRVEELLREHRPDVLVMTGHDGFSRKSKKRDDLAGYYNSKYFIEAVRRARGLRPEKDGLVIFAGACQSYYEAIIEAGANYASSPERELIHCFDPVFVAEKLCFTPLAETAAVHEVIEATITGKKGIGGIETRGLLRLGMPATGAEISAHAG